MGALKRLSLVFITSALSVSLVNASWLSDFLKSANMSITQESAGYYKTQASNFATGGGFRVRWQPFDGNLKLVSWTRPSINVGCNGIDATWGSFSYLNFDQLVAKLKKLSSAAPAFAFQLALSTLCKDCQTILDELESIVNAINSLNFDACSMAINSAKNIGTALNDSVVKGSYADYAAGWAGDKLTKTKELVSNWASTANAGIGTLEYAYESPSNKEQQQGSIIQIAVDKLDGQGAYAAKTILKMLELNEVTADKEVMKDFLRALFGDYVGYVVKEGDTVSGVSFTALEPKFDAKNFIKTFWLGDENATISFPRHKIECDRDIGCGPLTKTGADVTLKNIKSFKKASMETIESIVEKIRTDKDLDKDELTFINQQHIPLLDMINVYATGRLGLDNNIVEYISLTAFRMAIEDLVSEIQQTAATIYNDRASYQGMIDDKTFHTTVGIFQKNKTSFAAAFYEEFKKMSLEVQNKSQLITLIEDEMKRGFAGARSK